MLELLQRLIRLINITELSPVPKQYYLGLVQIKCISKKQINMIHVM